MTKILFVCHGNICRSPMAEYVMKYLCKDEEVYISSCATSTEELGNDLYYKTKEILNIHNIPYNKHQARQITKQDYNNYDYIIVMDDYNLYNIRRVIIDDYAHKVYKLNNFVGTNKDVDDPWYTRDFETCYQEIYNGCLNLKKFIKEKKYECKK